MLLLQPHISTIVLNHRFSTNQLITINLWHAQVNSRQTAQVHSFIILSSPFILFLFFSLQSNDGETVQENLYQGATVHNSWVVNNDNVSESRWYEDQWHHSSVFTLWQCSLLCTNLESIRLGMFARYYKELMAQDNGCICCFHKSR